MSKADELQKLSMLREKGVLTEEEFQVEKKKLLDREFNPFVTDSTQIYGIRFPTWHALMHLSQLLGIFTAGLGLVVPVLMWFVSKDIDPASRRHGLIIFNWIVSYIIYLSISAVFCIILIGYPFLIAFILAAVIFPVIAAYKAASGEEWRYPGSIRFFNSESKEDQTQKDL